MLIAFNKPMNVLSQFTDEGKWPGLKHWIDQPGVYAAGRLDRDSEGLLLLTDNGKLQAQLTSPKAKTPKTYLAQVEGEITPSALDALGKGLKLKDGPTRPTLARAVPEPNWLWPRDPPVRFRRSIPTTFSPMPTLKTPMATAFLAG